MNRRSLRSARPIWCAAFLLTIAAAFRPAQAVVSFADDSADISHTQWNPMAPYIGPEFMNGGVAVGDYDNDGDPDLYFTRYDDHDLLFANDGSGGFSDVTVAAGLDAWNLKSNAAAWGDVDNDGDLDLYVTTQTGTRYYLFINDGNGSFTEEAIARNAGCAGADAHFGYSVTFGDYDNDGYLDIHVNEWRHISMNPTMAASNARLLRNLGAANPGYFEDVTAAAGVELDSIPLLFGFEGNTSFSTRFVDLDLDGWLDLAISGDFGTSRLFWNDGDGTFSDGSAAAGIVGNGLGTAGDENGMGSAIGDYDGDGLSDWFVSAIYDPLDLCQCRNGLTGNRLYRNNGDRTFSDHTDLAGVRDGGWGWGAEFLDFDNDGDQDLTLNNGQSFLGILEPGIEAYANDTPRLWENDGGSMTEVAGSLGITASGSGKGVAVVDYDLDGDQDIVYVHNHGQPKLYRNDGGNQNDWLRVRVVGRGGARDGVGARVEVTTVLGQPPQVRDIQAGSAFLGQSESTAHFGLGAPSAQPVALIKVTWPNGDSPIVRTYAAIPRNQTIVAIPAKTRCGLLGIEPALVLLAMQGWLRRARRS